MTDHFLSSLRAEIAALEDDLARDPRYLKLRGLKEVLRLYDEGPAIVGRSDDTNKSPGAASAPPPKEGGVRGRRPSGDRVQAVTLSEEFIRGRTQPTPTREIYDWLIARGVTIGGKQPVSNLSAILSKSEGFRSIGRSGWILEPEGEGGISADAIPDDDLHEDREVPGAEVDDQGAGGRACLSYP